jgi:hypothetical protein
VCAPAVDDPIFTTSGSLPAGVHLVDNGDGSARLEGTPAAAPGTYAFSIIATGIGGVTTQAFMLTIAAATSVALTGSDPAPGALLALSLVVGGAGSLVLARFRRQVRRSARSR